MKPGVSGSLSATRSADSFPEAGKSFHLPAERKIPLVYREARVAERKRNFEVPGLDVLTPQEASGEEMSSSATGWQASWISSAAGARLRQFFRDRLWLRKVYLIPFEPLSSLSR